MDKVTTAKNCSRDVGVTDLSRQWNGHWGCLLLEHARWWWWSPPTSWLPLAGRRLQARVFTREAAVALGSFGILTRAIVFLMIGAFLAFAAYDANSSEALGFSGALRTLQAQPYGEVLLAFAGLGFIAFGGFEIIEAAARACARRSFEATGVHGAIGCCLVVAPIHHCPDV